MKKFLRHFSLFILFTPIFLYLKPVYLVYTDKYQESVVGKETYYSLKKSKRKNKAKKLLIGDSVAKQLFSNESFETPINSIACNQAIGFPGHYFLLNNYLQVGNKPDTVYLLFTPHVTTSCFQNNLNQVYTFHYFLKPFYTKEYIPLFTQTVFEQIHKIPLYFLSREPYILTSNWSPDFTSKDNYSYTFLSPISREYLKKIKGLSIVYHFTLILISTPVSIIQRRHLERIDHSEIAATGMEKEFNEYFKSISYLDEDFFIDGIHLKNPTTFTRIYKEKYFPELLHTSTTK